MSRLRLPALLLLAAAATSCRDDSDERYARDLYTICNVHQLSGQPPDKGFGAAAPWLKDHVYTVKGLRKLAQMPHVDLVAWHQELRREAADRGISPCHFADYWEDFLKRSR